MFGGVKERLDVGVTSIRPIVALEVVPEILHGIEFRRVRRQCDQGDIARAAQFFRAMKACPIPHHHGVNIVRQSLTESFEESVDDAGIEMSGDHSLGHAQRRRDGSQHIDVAVLRLPNGSRSSAALSPDARQCSLLAKAAFVLEEDMNLTIRAEPLNLVDSRGETF